MGNPELSIVIPVFNEEAVLPALVERLRVIDGAARSAGDGNDSGG